MSTAAFPLPLFALAEFPSVGESLRFQLVGLAVVFIVLGAIWGMMEMVGAFFKRRQAAIDAAKKKTQATPAPAAPVVTSAAPAPVAAAAPSDGPSPEITAVIAAAVHLVCGARHRIHAIAPVATENLDWAREGRRHIFLSHKTR
ncbi:MAG: OadG family protein [Opitutus sp.]|nr:OadG family protein [Opitutus sp.]